MRPAAVAALAAGLGLAASLAAPRALADATETEVAAAQLAAAIRGKDAKAIAARLHKRLDVAGVYFADAACAKRFEKHAELAPKDTDAFARCLAQLKLQTSTRRSSQPDGAVLTYDPGIELELQFERGQLAWIGYEAQGFADENVPTLSVQAFEALRKTGKTNVDDQVSPLLESLAAKGPVSAWLKLCLDATGAVTSASVREATSPKIGEVLAGATQDWTFQPFVHAGKKLPVCSLSLLTYPAAQAIPVEVLPLVASATAEEPSTGRQTGSQLGWQNIAPDMLEANRRTGSKAIAPDEAMKRRLLAEAKQAGKSSVKLVATYKLCVDEHGKVTEVAALKTSGHAAYDQRIEREMNAWSFRPFELRGTPTPVCTAYTFIYSAP